MFPLVTNCTYFPVVSLLLPTVHSPCFYDCARETSTTKLGRPTHDSSHSAAVSNAYNNIDLRKVERVHPMPFSPNVDRTDTTHQLTRSVKLALADSLIMCDECCVAGVEADTWIRGWERPRLKLVRKAITPDRPSSGDLTRVFDEFFVQVKEDLKTDVSGPETFRRLLRR